MKSNSKFLSAALSLTAFLVAQAAIPVAAQTTLVSQLATFDTAPTGSVFPGGDFDPNLDNAASCSGCWFGRPATSLTTYGHSTAHKTQGTGALRASVVGQGAGGSYSVNINGSPFELDTHFDYPLVATYSNNPAANGGVLDSRFTAIEAAVDSGQQALYNIEFDIIYDVDQMRSIAWQAPEETVNPGPNNENRYPQRYFWVGLFGQANDSFQFTGFDANTIAPFSAEYDNNKFPVFNASFPLSALNFIPNSTSAYYSIGVLYNSVHGTLPAASNTTGAVVYFDNFRLTKIDPVGPIDYNNNGQADAGDWQLFMAQYLVTAPPTPALNPNASFDLIGAFGAAGTNNVVDFHDLQKFQEFYSIANPAGAAALFGTVPEPGAFALAGLSLLALVFRRSRRQIHVLGALAAIVATLLSQTSAEAQLIEGFETTGRWAANAGADPNAVPITVAYSTANATQGTRSLKVTQGSDTLGGFSWNAAINPSWTTGDSAWDVLRQAVRTGAEHYNVLVDVTFDPVDLVDQGVNSLSVTLGLNFNGADIGTYAAETVKFTNTATIPLTQFDLPDSVDQGATSYSAQIGFAGDNPADLPYGVYIDNIRLEQISTPDLLTLEIDRASGIGTLKNLSTAPVSWDYFDVKSTGGSLNPAGWSSLDDQNVGGANTWIEAGGSTATEIAEASLTGSHTLNPGQTLTIGGLYNNSINAEDLVFAIRREGGPLNRTYDQIVTYTGVAPVGCIAGDFSCSGSVGNDDLTLLLDSWGDLVPPVPAGWNPHPNVAPTAPGVGNDELTALLDNWGNVAGSGSLASTSVPEPATASLGLLIALVAGIARRSPRS